MRIDVYLVKNGLVKSREKAVMLIKSHSVAVDGKIVEKPSFNVENNKVEVLEKLKYVSRGGYKLEKALREFLISPLNKTALDIGASTGGFTDCLLQHGASVVYALDVGHGQLDEELKNNVKVVNMENTDIRKLEESGDKYTDFDIITADVSFISLSSVIPCLFKLASDNSDIVLLVKPQFEAGRGYRKNGIVKDKNTHISVLDNIIKQAHENNLYVCGLTFSPIKGGDGNIEYLMHLKKHFIPNNVNIKDTVAAAHADLKRSL